MSTIEFSIIENETEFNFELVRLKPIAQLNFLLKIISVLAKGAQTKESSQKIEAMLNGVIETGVDFSSVKFNSDDKQVSLFTNALIGAFANFEDDDRDYIINTLLSTVTLTTKANIRIPMNAVEVDRKFASIKTLFQLLAEVIKLNFRSSGSESA